MKHIHLRARSVRVTSVALLVAGGFVAVAPSASADAPNSRAGATHASALNTAIKDTIATTGDQDWYRFVPTASG